MLKKLLGRNLSPHRLNSSKTHRKQWRTRLAPFLELLEDRQCPAIGLWQGTLGNGDVQGSGGGLSITSTSGTTSAVIDTSGSARSFSLSGTGTGVINISGVNCTGSGFALSSSGTVQNLAISSDFNGDGQGSCPPPVSGTGDVNYSGALTGTINVAYTQASGTWTANWTGNFGRSGTMNGTWRSNGQLANDLVATVLTWPSQTNDVQLAFRVDGADIPVVSSYQITLYWATAPSLAAAIGTAATVVVSDTKVGSYPKTIPVGSLSPIPLNATHLLAVVDSLDAVLESREDNNLVAIAIPDTTPPELTVPAIVIAEATGPAGAIVNFSASATDLVDGPVPVFCDPPSGSMFALGITHVICTATDSHGNVGSARFNVIVQDTTPPEVTVPVDITVEVTGPNGVVVNFTASATDLVDGALPVTCLPPSGSLFAVGTTPVICSATDSHGNVGSAGFNVIVVNTAAPVVTVPADITAEATGPGGATVSFSASATDLVDGSLPVICVPPSGSMFALGTTRVICSATDSDGNVGNASFNVIVVDTTPPEVTVPSDHIDEPPGITAEATGPTGARVTFQASAFDLVDGSVAVSCTPPSGSMFELDTRVVTCSATDAHGNVGSARFNVTVRDTTPPEITGPADVTAEATGPTGAVVVYNATATDLVDGSVSVTCSPESDSTFALGQSTVNCSAADRHGNIGTASFTVTVRDTTPPVLTLPENVTARATEPAGAVVTFAVPASDKVDGATSVTCSPPSGALFPIGRTVVTCSSADRAENSVSGTFSVQVTGGSQGQTDPAVISVDLLSSRGGIQAIRLKMSADLNADAATDRRNYRLDEVGPNRFGASTVLRSMRIRRVTYDPQTQTVEVTPAQRLREDRLYRISASSRRITDLSNDPLQSGNGSSGWYRAVVGRGTHLVYNDRDGDRVSLRLSGEGVMEFVQSSMPERSTLRLVDTVPGQSTLTGRVIRGLSGDGRAALAIVAPSGGFVNAMPPTIQVESPISVAVVDSLLASKNLMGLLN